MTRNWLRLARVSTPPRITRGGNGFLARVDHQGARGQQGFMLQEVGIVVNPH
jgi:hypothetical protein